MKHFARILLPTPLAPSHYPPYLRPPRKIPLSDRNSHATIDVLRDSGAVLVFIVYPLPAIPVPRPFRSEARTEDDRETIAGVAHVTVIRTWPVQLL